MRVSVFARNEPEDVGIINEEGYHRFAKCLCGAPIIIDVHNHKLRALQCSECGEVYFDLYYSDTRIDMVNMTKKITAGSGEEISWLPKKL